ncbi:MAG: hypothetical protein B5M51_06070 [Anaerolinea sp. 4484_236]|nr:MAG: hypothetical protein B5M51_06070 [Anaerolinea sp. 4484_236]
MSFSMFNFYNVIPATHTIVALNKILTLNNGILYELISLLAHSILYFAIAIWIFQRRHMRAV